MMAQIIKTSRLIHLTPCPAGFQGDAHSWDFEDARHIKLSPEPNGWVRIPLGNVGSAGMDRYVRTHQLQIVIQTMYQQGRDTHSEFAHSACQASSSGPVSSFTPPFPCRSPLHQSLWAAS
jgi:hypothetical protein